MEEKSLLDKLYSVFRVLLAVSSMLVNHQCILNKMSLNRNTHNARLHIALLTKVF